MSDRITITKRMLDLPTIREGGKYPHISYLSNQQTVGETLKQSQINSWRLRYIHPPRIYVYSLDDKDYWWREDPPFRVVYKLRFMFVFEKETKMSQERKFVKGGFIYDSPEQLDMWLKGNVTLFSTSREKSPYPPENGPYPPEIYRYSNLLTCDSRDAR